MKMKVMRIPRMQTPGHYRPRRSYTLPGQMNAPRRGRVGRITPSMKRMQAKGPVRRGR